MTSITLKNVRKEFGDVIAVDGLDLEIEDGEFVTFVGPSGCGKTTSLRLIAGLEQVTSGQIYFGERDVTNEIASKRNIGMVFQNLALYPHMTVRENMAFGLKVSNVPSDEREERINEAARMLDISDLLDRHPNQLSGGQQQRVAIGRTLVLKPDVFLLDEPLASLDAKLRIEIREELQELHAKTGITTIYVTHDQQQAMTMSDRIVVMSEGHVQQFDSPSNVYNEPNNRFVGDFIGTPPMNFLECSVAKREDHMAVDMGFKTLRLTETTLQNGRDEMDAELGIRPEHIHLRENNDGDFPATVQFVEPTGKEKIVRLSAENCNFSAIVPEGRNISRDETYSISFDPNRIYVFDKSTSKRIDEMPQTNQNTKPAR